MTFEESTFLFEPPKTWIAGTPAPVTIGGRPGMATRSAMGPKGDNYAWGLLWQPVDGLWAYVVVVGGDNLDRAVHLAETVRFDQVKKCVVPFTVGVPPVGSKLVKCSIALDTGGRSRYMEGQLTFAAGHQQVTFNGRPTLGDGVAGRHPLNAGANKVWVSSSGQSWMMMANGQFLDAYTSSKTAWSQQQMLASLATVRMLDQDHPGGW